MKKFRPGEILNPLGNKVIMLDTADDNSKYAHLESIDFSRNPWGKREYVSKAYKGTRKQCLKLYEKLIKSMPNASTNLGDHLKLILEKRDFDVFYIMVHYTFDRYYRSDDKVEITVL